jgi:hypothetical protein
MHYCGLTQLITNPNRIFSNSAKPFDHIYVNQIQNISNSVILPFNVTDRQPIFVVRKLRFQKKSHDENYITIKYKDWKNNNFKSIERKLN